MYRNVITGLIIVTSREILVKQKIIEASKSLEVILEHKFLILCLCMKITIKDKLTGRRIYAIIEYPKSRRGNGSEKIGKLLKAGPISRINDLIAKAGICIMGSLLY
jgi:hypothetical protein